MRDDKPKYVTANKTTYLKTPPLKSNNLKPIVKTHIAFWVPLYINSLHFLCSLLGTQPDPIKRRKIIAKGIRWERIQ
ncbi:hypothetical protein [Shewanella surugensis]|uniref:Uncharacterized protein n=1 Tax=Shewanella surugensis TaxID=212020 RepID=A0ABT0LHJ6_9GAMM|nr:hypothetical protein [Shewanella surugensis]MCL1127187.1 hypothetical protein [Shewanella surugensis]